MGLRVERVSWVVGWVWLLNLVNQLLRAWAREGWTRATGRRAALGGDDGGGAAAEGALGDFSSYRRMGLLREELGGRVRARRRWAEAVDVEGRDRKSVV